MRETRIFGPPGTGKTTYLSRQIEAAAEKYDPSDIMVASFTRTAAVELNSRKLPIPRQNIGTLHALCYRSMNSPEIAETHIDEFNKVHPEYELSDEYSGNMEENLVDANFKKEADRYLAYYNIHRARMQPITQERVPPSMLGFIKAWERWKLENDYVDFTDMVSMTLKSKAPPPGGARVGIYDEVQDFNPLELALVRSWAEHQDFALLAGDDDQAIYTFTGASPDAFLYPDIPQAQKRVLSQSWRLPKKVKEFADAWIKNVSIREPKDYKPRDFEGEVLEQFSNFRMPERLIDEAERYISNGKTVMFLATCGYMLTQIKATLKGRAIPFHNPYRKTRGDWNPLGSFVKVRGRTYMRERILAFLKKDGIGTRNYWDFPDLEAWTDIIKSKGVLTKKAKEAIEAVNESLSGVPPQGIDQFYSEIFEPQALECALRRDLDWFVESVLGSKRNQIEFPVNVYKRRGEQALLEQPKVVISTIHGVKGGEADVVFLFPDISLAGAKEYNSSAEGRDSIIRTFYVGMTRARETLVLCQPVTSLCARFQ